MATNKKAQKGGSRYFVIYTAVIIIVAVALFVINQQSGNSGGETNILDSAPSTTAQPVMGDTNAKVSIVEFGDYKCPSCKSWGETVWPQLKADYVDTGKATFSYINVLFHGEESQVGAIASESMLKMYPEQFWDFHKKLFDAQPANHDSHWLTEAKVLEVAKASVPDLDETKLKEVMASEEAGQLVQLDSILVNQFNLQYTPTIMINEIEIKDPFDIKAIRAAIEQELGGEQEQEA
ncbi:DsbA family protein [Paenibacillus soyae]|uniref:DsbA family protein n=1 Tax=Paenibacillus soyae TaxID=2969249 RepID=A0A9X2MRV3_9BACL|nr:DsbA family protein [Paenibacillus soyae]MCR2807148.1 DsbA family protein [Paenibacillus soyae]